MPSSISNSDASVLTSDTVAYIAPAPVRETAADRPGVAQPVPLRPVPVQPWNRIFLGMLVLFVLLLGAWEWHWRAFGAEPTIANSAGLWSIQRRRIDNGEGDATVLLGASRVLFDVQLDVWERVAGKRPIQLALEGTSPLMFMEDLAEDPKFTGHLLVGVAPDLFFSGYAYRGDVFKYYRKESPSQRVGQWLSQHFIEPYFAFDDPDFALATVLKRQDWPARPGKRWGTDVRKLRVSEADRNTHIWEKVENDTEYRALARNIWLQEFVPSDDDPSPEKWQQLLNEQIDRSVAAVTKLRARGVRVLFVRPPSTGPYLEFENKVLPRAKTWDVLLARTGAPGIHFEDYPELQGMELPEWSHLTHADANRYTEALVRIIQRDFWKDPASVAAIPTSIPLSAIAASPETETTAD
jgi:hypothetical protein